MRKIAPILMVLLAVVTSHAVLAETKSAEFLRKAMLNSLTEVELGRLAGTNARSTGINAFGSRLARDHGRISSIIEHISRDKGITVPTTLDAEHRAIVERLSRKTGTEFDVAYAELMVSAHEKAIALFTEATQSDDPVLAEFANRALPTLREQKRLADNFQKMTESYRPEDRALESVARRG